MGRYGEVWGDIQRLGSRLISGDLSSSRVISAHLGSSRLSVEGFTRCRGRCRLSSCPCPYLPISPHISPYLHTLSRSLPTVFVPMSPVETPAVSRPPVRMSIRKACGPACTRRHPRGGSTALCRVLGAPRESAGRAMTPSDDSGYSGVRPKAAECVSARARVGRQECVLSSTRPLGVGCLCALRRWKGRPGRPPNQE